jgi:hypothetical protein
VPFALGEFTSQRISGAKFLRIKDGGHFCTVTHREVIIPRIRNLLDIVGSK